MVLVGVIRFVGYREWTESLGPDREWYIQVVQSKIYQVNQLYTAEYEGLALPLRYDIQLVILPGNINVKKYVNGLKYILKPYSPTPLKVTLLCGPVPDVIEKVKTYEELGDYYEPCRPVDVVVAHADLNYFTQKTFSHGPYVTYVEMMKLVSHFANVLENKAIVQYLGGDNLAIITSKEKMKDVIQTLTKWNGIKVGVGISPYPRKAFAMAAKALSKIRAEGRVRQYYVIEE